MGWRSRVRYQPRFRGRNSFKKPQASNRAFYPARLRPPGRGNGGQGEHDHGGHPESSERDSRTRRSDRRRILAQVDRRHPGLERDWEIDLRGSIPDGRHRARRTGAVRHPRGTSGTDHARGRPHGLRHAQVLREKPLFHPSQGPQFKKMIEEQLPQLVKARADYNIKTRVVIDPMTPVIWATAEKLEQRELIGKLFYTLKELGVVLCTVEEHAKPGETIGEDVLLTIYLSDGAIHLEYYPIGGAFNRTVKLL